MAEAGGGRKAIVTTTSMYVPAGARVSFVDDDEETPAARPKDSTSRSRTRKLTRVQTRTSFMDKAFEARASATDTYRIMAGQDMSARKLFATLDADNSGYLDLEEVSQLSAMLGVKVSKREVRAAFAEMDEDDDCMVTLDEFSQWWQNVRENDRRKVRRKVRNAFHKLDHNGDGTITKREFAQLMSIRMRQLMNLLGGPFDLEKDWALMHRSFVEMGGELTDDLPVSFSLFERWWKFRNGIDDGEVPVIPETMALCINQAGAMDPDALRRAAAKRKREEQRASGDQDDIADERRGAELWSFLRPRLRLLVELQKKWGDVSDIYDSHTKSYYEEVQLPRCIRDPRTHLAAMWDMLQLGFLVYISIAVPLRVCFDIKVPVWSLSFWLDNIVDLYFIVDLGLQFRTSFERKDGMMEDDARAIAERYLKTWFAVDFISCIPVQYIDMLMADDSGDTSVSVGEPATGKDASGSEFKALKALRLVRMSKMLRLAKVKRILAKYQEEFDLMQYVEMYALIAIICLLAHMLSCFFYLIGDADEQCFFESSVIPCSYDASKPDEPGLLRGWVYMEFGSMAEQSLVPSVGVRYWTSLYYVFNALEPHILTDGERGFAVLAELVMAIIYGSIAGVMSTIMMGMQGSTHETQAKIRGLRRWVSNHKMTKPMQKGILSYFNELWTQRAGLNTAELLEMMPPQLRLEVTTIFYRDALASTPLFKGLSEEILFQLCRECRPLMILKGEDVVKEGEPGQEMYILLDGEVQVSVGGAKTVANTDGMNRGGGQRNKQATTVPRQDLGYLSSGAFFGEAPIMSMLDGLHKYLDTLDPKYLNATKDTVRSRTITAVTACELCYLTRDSIMKVAIQYPELRARLMRFTRPAHKKPVDETLTSAEMAKLGMLKVRVHQAANHGRDMRRQSVTKEQAEKVAAAAAAVTAGAASSYTDVWAAKMQEKIKQSSVEVQKELARRAEKHATEFEQKVQRALQLMAG